MPAIGMIPHLFENMGFSGCYWRSYLTESMENRRGGRAGPGSAVSCKARLVRQLDRVGREREKKDKVRGTKRRMGGWF
jgi:hypothetical protein